MNTLYWEISHRRKIVEFSLVNLVNIAHLIPFFSAEVDVCLENKHWRQNGWTVNRRLMKEDCPNSSADSQGMFSAEVSSGSYFVTHASSVEKSEFFQTALSSGNHGFENKSLFQPSRWDTYVRLYSDLHRFHLWQFVPQRVFARTVLEGHVGFTCSWERV